MGFSPGIASTVLAFIDIARHNPDVVISRVASLAGTNILSVFNGVNRFLAKIGKASDPKASIVEKMRAAFPPRE